MTNLIYCEILKIRKSSVFLVLNIAFALLPGISLFKYFNSPGVGWNAYLSEVLHLFSAILVIGFAFTTCWAFGREYTDKTINDLLVKPVSKLNIALSKYAALFLWNSLLTVIMFAVVVLLGAYIGLTGGAAGLILRYFAAFYATAALTMLVSALSSFMANVTRGYLAPIGLIFVIVIIINFADNLGLQAYIPWTIPGLLLTDGALQPLSAAILAATSLAGFIGTVAWWRYREQR